MDEPSQEALALAWALVERAVMRCELAPLFAVELQKLMNERDQAQSCWERAVKLSADIEQRAEVAEKERDEARRVARALACKQDNVTEASEAALAYPKVRQ